MFWFKKMSISVFHLTILILKKFEKIVINYLFARASDTAYSSPPTCGFLQTLRQHYAAWYPTNGENLLTLRAG
jgi:hypothetical protein